MFQGGNSIVTKHDYTVKQIIRDQDYNEPFNVAALREAYLQELAGMYYKYIPKVLKVKDDKIYMSYIPNAMLLVDYLKADHSRKTFARKKVINILKAMKAAGIHHKDVSCENILIDGKNHFWLIDFGLAEKVSKDKVDESFINDLNIYNTSVYILVDYIRPNEDDSDED